MGSPSPAATKLKRESNSTTRAAGPPHRRTSSVTLSCVSLESGDQDHAVYSPARSTGSGKSPAATTTSSPRTPAGAGADPIDRKSVSPAAMKKKRRSSIGGTDDLARGLDFTTSSSSPAHEEKKLHSFLTKGGGHKKVAQSESSPGKKVGTAPPGKEKLVAGRASSSVLSPRKVSDGRKKDTSSPQKSEGSSTMNGVKSAPNSDHQLGMSPAKKSSPLRVSVDGKTGKLSSPRPTTKAKSEVVLSSTKGRITNLNGELAAVDNISSVDQPETKPDHKVSPLDGKVAKKSSPRFSKSSTLTSSTGRIKVTQKRQDTPSPPQSGRVKTRINDKAARNEELSRPEMESVEVPVYEYERDVKSEKMLVPILQQRDSADDEERSSSSALLASLMVGGNVDMSCSLEQGVHHEPGFDNDTEELPTSWLSEDLPCMFSSLSQLPEPDVDSSSSLLGDPPEVTLDVEPFQRHSPEHQALTHDMVAAETILISSSVMVSSPQSPVSTVDAKFHVAADHDPSEVDTFEAELGTQEIDATYEVQSLQLSVPEVDKFAAELRSQIDATYEVKSPQLSVLPEVEDDVPVDKFEAEVLGAKTETSTFESVTQVEDDDPVDKFEAELRSQIGAAYEVSSPQLSVPEVEDDDPVDKFEAELRTQIDTTFESPQLSVPPVGGETVAMTTSLHTVDKGETMGTYKFTTHDPEDISSSTSDNESSESVANEAFLQRCMSQVTEEIQTGEGQICQLISIQVVEDPTEVIQVVPVEAGDEEIFQLHDDDSPSSAKVHMTSDPTAKPPLQEEAGISTSHSCPDQQVVESSDEEFEGTVDSDSDSAQLNLKQSFDDVAEPLAVSGSRDVDDIDISHANTVSIDNIVPVMVSTPREDNAIMDQYAIGPQELAAECGAADGQDCGAFITPTYDLDQDMKIFEEYWTQSVADHESGSQSDAGQNDAEDPVLQPSTTTSEAQLLPAAEDEAEKISSLPLIDLPVVAPLVSPQSSCTLSSPMVPVSNEDAHFSWTGDKEAGESSNRILEQTDLLPEDHVDSEKSDQDTALNVDVDEMEEDSESFVTESEKDSVYLNGRLEEEPLFEDEEMVVFSPKNSYGNALGSDTGANDVQHNSTSSCQVDGEKDYLEDMLVVSGQNTAILDVDEVEEQTNSSWIACKNEEMSVNGISLERDSVLEDEECAVPNPFNETPDTTISDVHSPSNVSWTADDKDELESVTGSQLEDEDTVVYRPLESLVVSGHDLPGEISLLVDDKVEPGHVKVSETADMEGKNLHGIEVEEAVPEMENAKPEVENAMPEVEEAVPEVENAMPEVEEAVPEVENAMPEVEEAVPEVENAMPEVEEAVLEVEDAMLEVEAVIPEVEAVIPEVKVVLPEAEEAKPETEEAEPETEEAMPEVKVVLPEVEVVLPEVEEAMLEVEAAKPEVEEAMPEVENAMFEVEEAMLEVKEAMLEVKEAKPEVEESMPEVENAMLEVEEAMLEVKEAKLEVEEAIPEVEAATPEEAPMVDKHEESAPFVVQIDTIAEALLVDDGENQAPWRDHDEGEEENVNGDILEKSESVDVEVQEPVDDSPTSESPILVPDAENSDVDEMMKSHPTWRTHDEEGEPEKSTFEDEETEVDSPKEASVIANGTAISDVDNLEKPSPRATDKDEESVNRNLEEESVLEVLQAETVTVDSSSTGTVKNVLVCPEASGAPQSNSEYNMGDSEDVVCHSKSEDGAMTLHDKDAVDMSVPEAVRPVENLSLVVKTHHVVEDSDPAAAVIPEMTNGDHHQESDCSDAVIEAPVSGTSSSLESNPLDVEEATEPQSPDSATLYPLLASQQPPFSGSQQDRLWEEQAEAYSSGGRGTPSRNEDVVTQAAAAAAPFHPPSPGDQPATSSEDQIQPASNGHTLPGPASNGAGENGSTAHEQEAKGKGKLHTPLRSLLLEDASKSTDHGDPSTGNGVTTSPSFIRRLFRVMSTPSRAAERDVVTQPKLKKSSSMWVSCLGSPQVQQ